MYISRGLQQLETSKAELEVVEDELEARFGGQQPTVFFLKVNLGGLVRVSQVYKKNLGT